MSEDAGVKEKPKSRKWASTCRGEAARPQTPSEPSSHRTPHLVKAAKGKRKQVSAQGRRGRDGAGPRDGGCSPCWVKPLPPALRPASVYPAGPDTL